MIGRLRGTLVAKQPPWLLIDVGGVGYELEAPMSTIYGLPAEGQSVTLHTHLVIRDDAHLLFGFGSERERRLFRALLKVSGIGAKMGLAILSTMSADEFAAVIDSGDAAMLTRVPGIGKKTAERVLLELRDRLDGVAGEPTVGTGGGRGEAIEALIALGYSAAEARKLVDKVDASHERAQDIIRAALQRAAR